MKRFNAGAKLIFEGTVATLVRSIGMYDTLCLLHARAMIRLLQNHLHDRFTYTLQLRMLKAVWFEIKNLIDKTRPVTGWHAIRMMVIGRLCTMAFALKHFNRDKKQFQRILDTFK